MTSSGGSETHGSGSQAKSLLCFLLVSISAGVAYNASYVFLSSMTTTLERRFGFDAEDSGRIIVAGDIGFAATVVLVGFYGNRAHRPRVLGLGVIAMGLSTAAYSLPYFVYGPKYSAVEIQEYLTLADRSVGGDTRPGRLDGRNASSFSAFSSTTVGDSSKEAAGDSSDPLLCRRRLSADLKADAEADSTLVSMTTQANLASATTIASSSSVRNAVYGIFMSAGILQGAASAPSWSVLFTLVEDSAAPSRSPVYIGLVITARSVSPMLGYYLVSQLLALPESLGAGRGLRESDSLWIGNWWLGFLCLGLLTSALGCPLLLFPRRLEDRVCCLATTPPEEPEASNHPTQDSSNKDLRLQSEKPRKKTTGEDTDVTEEMEEETTQQTAAARPSTRLLHSLRDLWQASRRTMSNAILMLIVLCCVLSLLGSGLEMLFGVKYYENYFNVLPSAAGQYVGLTYALPSAMATLAGGYLVSRLKLGVLGMMRLLCAVFLATTALNAPAFFLHCPSEPLAEQGSSLEISACNSGCGCDPRLLSSFPVCGADTRFYISPCHAGCTEGGGGGVSGANASRQSSSAPPSLTFGSCECIKQQLEANSTNTTLSTAEPPVPSPTARSGSCHGLCSMVYPFSVLKFLAHFSEGLSNVSWFLLVMRVTKTKDDEAMGVGTISMFFSLTASIMGGICGRIYESACLASASGAAGERNCLLYDKQRLRVLFNGIPMLARLPYCALLLAAYALARRRYGNGKGDRDGDGDGDGDGEAKDENAGVEPGTLDGAVSPMLATNTV